MKPVAWMYPTVLSFKNAARTNCPTELQPEMEGTVAWHPEIYGENYSVTDKNGVFHKSYPLYSEADVRSLQAERDRLREALVRIVEDDDVGIPDFDDAKVYAGIARRALEETKS